MGASGIFLILYVIVHLLGNLTIFSPSPNTFNQYAHKLIGLGPFLYVIEIILLAGFVIHFIWGIYIKLENVRARGKGYAVYKSKGEPSQQTPSSRTMIYSGLILAIFVVLHVKTFKYGPGVEEGYAVQIKGETVRDLHKLMIDVFSQTKYVVWYVVAMIFLVLHIRHGFWSAFQSLGTTKSPLISRLVKTGIILAIILGLGYISIPLWIYFGGPK